MLQMRKYIETIFRICLVLFVLCICYACANIGNPNGGPYDETPPRFVSSTPLPNQLNYKGKTVEIYFDELVQLDNPSENVVVTPPQKEMPIIQAIGKRVSVELLDTLVKDMTYTIDFTNSIVDNNEKNVFENFSFAFSTGDIIDTLEVSGIVLNAENLEPMQGITIGLHSNLDDSAFVSLPFVRTSRTNDRGRFTIRNITPGKYRVYALKDANRDYKFDQPGEDIAFTEEVFVPTFEPATRQDTIWTDSLTIDTIMVVNYTRYFPDNIELRLFKEKFERQYMLRPERLSEKTFQLKFNADLDTLPVPCLINAESEQENWYMTNEKEGRKVIEYWITDSTVWALDTLSLEVTYPASDSLNRLLPKTDTITLISRGRQEVEKKKKRRKKDEPEPIEFLTLNIKAPSSLEVYDTIQIVFAEPVLNLEKESFALKELVDSVWTDVDFRFLRDTANALAYQIIHGWKYGGKYQLSLDSAAITSVYGKWNDRYRQEMTVKKEEDYGDLYINISGLDGSSAVFVELLNANDAPIRRVTLKNGGVLFPDLKPDKYYARLVVDRNGNGKWDTGEYASKTQPEEVYYYPKQLSVMQNWDIEEYWNVKETPLSKQKPLEVTKNKPKELNKPKRNYKDESKSSSSSGGIVGMPF